MYLWPHRGVEHKLTKDRFTRLVESIVTKLIAEGALDITDFRDGLGMPLEDVDGGFSEAGIGGGGRKGSGSRAWWGLWVLWVSACIVHWYFIRFLFFRLKSNCL